MVMDLIHPAGGRRWRAGPSWLRRQLQRCTAPWSFYSQARRVMPVLAAMAGVLALAALRAGWASGMAHSEADRVLAVHLPATWLAVTLLVAAATLTWAGRGTPAGLPLLLAQALAPSAAVMAGLAVVTGALWQQATGGGLPPWAVPMPDGAVPLAGALAAVVAVTVLQRARLLIVEQARRSLRNGGLE